MPHIWTHVGATESRRASRTTNLTVTPGVLLLIGVVFLPLLWVKLRPQSCLSPTPHAKIISRQRCRQAKLS